MQEILTVGPEKVEEAKGNKESKESQESQKPPKKFGKKRLIFIILGVAIAAGLVFLAFYLTGRSTGLLKPLSQIGWKTPSEKVQNPLTGETFEKDKSPFFEQRVLGIMIDNHTDARPQSGLIYADLVYEIVAEGGITRFLAFYLGNTPEKVGPVRSTREYYLVLVKELGDAMLMHIGWSPQALEAIETWPVRSLARGGATFWRENPRNVASEHTAYVDGVYLRKRAEELGWQGVGNFTVWKFKEDKKGYETMPLASNVAVDFWYEGGYSTIWNYDESASSYKRSMGYAVDGNPVAHVDNETGRQIAVKNVIVQFAEEIGIEGDDKSRLEYQLVGSGSGLVFLDGRVVEVTWSKSGRDDRTMFYDINGNEVNFNRGNFWICIVPSRNAEQVVYK